MPCWPGKACSLLGKWFVSRLLPMVLLLLAGQLPAQDTATTGNVRILNADAWTFDDDYAPGTQRLVGNVRLEHGGAIMHCDSAWLKEDQTIDAYGHIDIRQGDTLRVQGDRLAYRGRQRVAELTGNVLLRDPGSELTTEHLIYDLRGKRATYTGGGTIVDRHGGDTLRSGLGTYLSDQRLFIFSRDVRLDHPDRQIRSDTLHYATTTGEARFLGPTEIVLDSTRILCRRGRYDTRNEVAVFSRYARILRRGQELGGDSLHYARRTGVGEAWGNVSVTDTVNDLSVHGEHGRFLELADSLFITGRAELIMAMEGDTLFLHADTLFALPDSGNARIILARRGVRFHKSDLQGVCDTLLYLQADSLIHLRGDPYVWSGTDQISGRPMRITLRNGQAHRLFVERDAFVVSQVDSVLFDQVAGRELTGFFLDGKIRRILVEGNSRTVYHAIEEKGDERSIIGVNRADCSRIEVTIAEDEVHSVAFRDRPDAVMYPLEKAPPEEVRLPGLHWNASARPTDRASIFR